MKIITRALNTPKSDFFLLGPRGTGKSFWLKQEFKADLYIDLLQGRVFLDHSQDPDLLRSTILGSPKIKRIVIDEVQKLPSILDEVHSLIEDHPKKFIFALTGSSARKLKRSNANLLAGRAVTRSFFPLTAFELKSEFHLEDALRFGTLPKVCLLSSNEERADFLKSYCETYLREEIQQEAQVRNLVSYTRFLRHIALRHGQVINLSNIAREAGIRRSPLENYMSLLVDTLLGTIIEPIHLRAKVKEVSTPKFYFFDSGVAEALSGHLNSPMDSRSGSLLEGLVLNEIKSYQSNKGLLFDINYWGTPSDNEVDFILTKGKVAVGIEVKNSKKWSPDFSKGLNTLLESKKIQKAYIVFNGKQRELRDKIEILPYLDFSQALNEGEII